jgi:hypothetical protein
LPKLLIVPSFLCMAAIPYGQAVYAAASFESRERRHSQASITRLQTHSALVLRADSTIIVGQFTN